MLHSWLAAVIAVIQS